MSWNISVTTVIGGGGNRPGIYSGKFNPNEFHDLPFLVKLPVGSLFLKTGEQNPDCTVGCAAGIYQKVCSDCGSSSWATVNFRPPKVITFTTEKGALVNINLVQSGDTPIWATGDGAVYNTKNLAHVYSAGSFSGYAEMFSKATEVDCSEEGLTALDVSGLISSLDSLRCDDNSLAALDLSDFTALTYLVCWINQLASLDVSGCQALDALYCDANLLEALDVSDCVLLTHLDCSINQLTALDLSANTILVTLICNTNQLTALDLSENPLLENLDCRVNSLTALDLSANPLLGYLECGFNQLTALDLSENPLLDYIRVTDNLMPEAAVDQVLADVQAYGTSYGTLDMSGTNAAPSAAGLADVALLQGRGWTVTTS